MGTRKYTWLVTTELCSIKRLATLKLEYVFLGHILPVFPKFLLIILSEKATALNIWEHTGVNLIYEARFSPCYPSLLK